MKVQLKEVPTTVKSREPYEDALDQAFYELNDC